MYISKTIRFKITIKLFMTMLIIILLMGVITYFAAMQYFINDYKKPQYVLV